MLTEKDQKKVIEWRNNGKNFLLYFGCPGCGKTHFCHAVLNDFAKNFRYKRFWSEFDFFKKVKDDFEICSSYERTVDYISDDDLIIFDDMGSSNPTDWKKDVLFRFINNRYESQKPTIITSNLTEEEIYTSLGSRAHSRLFSKENTILDFGNIDWRRFDSKVDDQNDSK